MIANTILAKNRRGLKALSLTMTFASSEIVEIAARAGFDAINLDGEHGAFSPESVDLMCRVANGYGISVTARVPSIDAWQINLWLDRGIQGIVAPHVESGDEAQRLVDACLYPPAGRRSWGWGRGSDFNEADRMEGGRRGFALRANAELIVAAQIESKKGYSNLEAILAVEGLTAITGGPNDLAASLGHPGEPGRPEQVKLEREVDERGRRAGKPPLSDLVIGLVLHDLLLGSWREIAARHAETKVGA